MKKIFISALLFIVSTIGWGQESISLEQYRQRVVDYSQEIKKAKEGITSAESQTKAIKTGFLPKLSLSAEGNYQANRIKFDLGEGNAMEIKPWGYTATASITQNIYSGNAVRNQYKVSQIGENISRNAEKLTIDNIIYAADMYYWQLAAYKSLLKIAQDNLSLVNSLYGIIKERFTDGLISKNDLLMIETRNKESEIQLSNATKRYRTALINFNVMMGIESQQEVMLADNIESIVAIPEKISLEEALTLRADYKIAESQVTLQQYSLKASLAQFRPQIVAGINGTYGSMIINISGQGMANGIVFGQINIPVFEWGRKKHIKNMGEANIRSYEFEQSAVKDKIIQEINTTWSELTQNESELSIALSTMSIAQESLDLNTLSYNEGRLTILDVLSSQMSWLLSLNNVVATNLQYKASLAQYNKAVGLYSSYTAQK